MLAALVAAIAALALALLASSVASWHIPWVFDY